MKLLKEIVFASTLSLLALLNVQKAHAHETKVGDITIQHPWARQSPMKATVAAGFMIITNAGKEDDRLVKATAEITTNVQLHDMKMDGDVMKMFELKGGIVIPAGKTVELKPKSMHVMFMDLKAVPVKGQMFRGKLTFEKAGTVDVEYEVTNPDAGMN